MHSNCTVQQTAIKNVQPFCFCDHTRSHNNVMSIATFHNCIVNRMTMQGCIATDLSCNSRRKLSPQNRVHQRALPVEPFLCCDKAVDGPFSINLTVLLQVQSCTFTIYIQPQFQSTLGLYEALIFVFFCIIFHFAARHCIIFVFSQIINSSCDC